MRSETCSTSIAVERAHRGDDRLLVRLPGGEHGDVADLLAGLDADEVDRVEQAAGVADRLGEPREGAGPVVEMDPERRAELRGEVAHGPRRA